MEKKYLFSAFADEAGDTVEEQIDALKSNGMSMIEIRLFGSDFICNMSMDRVKEIKKQLDDGGISVWSLGSSIGKIGIKDDYAAHLEKMRYVLEIAHALETDNLRMFSFYIPKGEDPYVYRDEVMERMSRLSEEAKGSSIALCHENEKDIYGDNAARCLEILEKLPEYHAVFDPANFVQVGQDTMEAWKLLKPYVKYLHIKDALADGTVVPAGEGIGNVGFIVNDFLSSGGQVMTLEPHLTNFTARTILEPGANIEAKPVFTPRREAFNLAANALKGLLK